ncbi:MAG: ABC transporter substrate-binding protein [Chloroflexi bacterium]|nr:ABC transporter substrate-binding protein [Chloroflexota bacterium]
MRKHSLIILFAVMLIALLLGGCASAVTPAATTAPAPVKPNLTGKTIKVYGMTDLSGPTATTTASVAAGAKDMIAYINETGGIFGAKLELQFEDTALKVDQAVAIFDRWTSQDKNIVIALIFGTPEQQALKDRIKQSKVPTMGAGPDFVALYGVKDGWQFASAPLWDEQLSYFMDYVVANWARIKPAKAGDKVKLAYLSWSTALGQAALTDASKAYLKNLGVEIVSTELYESNPKADTTTAILNAQAAGANVVWNNTAGFGIANLLNDMKKLGVRDQFVVGTAMLGMDIATYAFLADKANADGLYGTMAYAWWSDADNPAIKLANELATKYNTPANLKSFGRIIAQAQLDIARKALEDAILKVGYDNLNGQAVYDALTALKGYKPLGGLTTVDFTGGARAGRQLQIRQIQGGPDKFVVIKDFALAPDFRPK